MASIGDALIYGLPFLILSIGIFGALNELYFMSVANLGVDEWDEYDGKCFSFENKTDIFCKNDFGFMGMKQWVDEDDYELLSTIFTVNDTKTVIISP